MSCQPNFGRLPGRLKQAAHHAAHAIAAGASLGTVLVVDSDESRSPGKARLLQHHQLVIRNVRGHGPRVRLRHRPLRVAQIDDNDLVADPVHLCEGVVGERAHENIQFVPALYGE